MVLLLEAVGITAAVLAVVLARSAPADPAEWWRQQEWLHRWVLGEPPPGQADEPGLTILPWDPD